MAGFNNPADGTLRLYPSPATTTDTTRIAGRDVVEFSVNVSRFVFPSRNVFWVARSAVLVPFDLPLDAALGTPVVHHPRNAVLLTTSRESLSPLTREELVRLRPSGVGTDGRPLPAQVFLVGGLSENVRHDVESLGLSVMRLGGTDPFDTAAVVTRFVEQEEPVPKPAMILSVDNMVEWLAAPALAIHEGAPILYVGTNFIPPVTEQAIRMLPPVNIYVIGNERNVSPAVFAGLQQIAPRQVLRIPGDSPFTIAVNLARFFNPDDGFGWNRNLPRGDVFSFASVLDWFPAILGTEPSHVAKHAPMLLVDADAVPSVVQSYLLALNPPLGNPPMPPFMHGLVLGDFNQISPQVQVELEQLLIKEANHWPPMH